MNWQVFGTIGYLGIALGVAAVLVWLVHWQKQHRFLPYIGFILALASLVCARINSTQHVARVEVDPSIMLAMMDEERKKKEQALLESRTDEVDNIRFAEDAQGENLDIAGMDEVDLKYLKAIQEAETPEWAKKKKARGENAQEDDSLESAIGAKKQSEGANVEALEEEEAPEPILMDEASVVLASEMDLWNLRVSEWLFYIAILILLLDYIRRANIYREALWPIPLPSSWLQAFTPLPVVYHQPEKPRRDVASQLAWFTRRGDQWIYFTDQPGKTAEIKDSLGKLKKWPYRLDLLEVDDRMDNELVMESAWYGRASFICDSAERGVGLLGHCLSQLKHRRITKAHAPQYVHLVWDCDQELSPDAFEAFQERAVHSRVSLYVIPQAAKENPSPEEDS